MYFCLLLLMKINCSLPAVTAASAPHCALGLLGEGGNGRPDLKVQRSGTARGGHEARNTTWLIFVWSGIAQL